MVEVPQVQFIDKVIDITVIRERQTSMMNKVQKTVEVQSVDELTEWWIPWSCEGRLP